MATSGDIAIRLTRGGQRVIGGDGDERIEARIVFRNRAQCVFGQALGTETASVEM